MADKTSPAVPPAKAQPRRREAGPESQLAAARAGGSEERGRQWPVWTAVVLTGLYVVIHLYMVPIALTLWGGLLSALVLGE